MPYSQAPGSRRRAVFGAGLLLVLIFKLRLCQDRGSFLQQQQRQQQRRLPRLPKSPTACSRCPYVAKEQVEMGATDAITMTTTSGFGRSGNYFLSMRKAMRRAHECKTKVRLPPKDAEGDLFTPPQKYQNFDFSSRPGPIHPSCKDPEVGAGLTGNSKTFWFLTQLQNETEAEVEYFEAYKPEPRVVDDCFRWYINVCGDYCEGLELEDTLVAHVRQGDVFPKNFREKEFFSFSMYGQPPLSYYLTAITMLPWKKILLVGEGGENVSPVWAALKMLDKLGALKVPLEFQSKEWKEDFRTLMCAPNYLESKTTLNQVLQLGAAQRRFSLHCSTTPLPETDVYRIPLGDKYEPFEKHTNSKQEWITMLLHDLPQKPQLCAKNSGWEFDYRFVQILISPPNPRKTPLRLEGSVVGENVEDKKRRKK